MAEVREGIPDRAAAEGWLTEPAEEPLDAVLWLSAEADAELIHDSTSSRSRVAEGRVSERLARLREEAAGALMTASARLRSRRFTQLARSRTSTEDAGDPIAGLGGGGAAETSWYCSFILRYRVSK